MTIDFACPSCGKKLKAKEAAAGKIAPCPQCGTKIRVPAAPATGNTSVPVKPAPAPAASSSGTSPTKAPATSPVAKTTTAPGTAPVAKTSATPLKPVNWNIGANQSTGTPQQPVAKPVAKTQAPTPVAKPVAKTPTTTPVARSKVKASAPASVAPAKPATDVTQDNSLDGLSGLDASLGDFLLSELPPVPVRPQVTQPVMPQLATAPQTSGEKLAQAKKMAPFVLHQTPLWLRHLHWFLALSLIPLAFSLMIADDDDIERRFKSTIENAPAEVQVRIASALNSESEDDSESEEDSEFDVFGVLPDGKIQGAWLSRSSYAHWGLAAASTVLFMGFFLFLSVDKSADPIHLLLVGLFTATIGIFLLLSLQLVADATNGFSFRVRGWGVIILLVLKFIAFSYNAALDPENGFWLSFFGFTFGVGLCEELCKAMPLVWHHRSENSQSWRGAFLWGLASGAGFGIAEGIKYSSEYYNGVHGPGIYLVRFISCVALHALWAGSIGITTQQNKEMLQCDMDSILELILPVLRMVAVPMVLHGLYDTLLKKDMPGWALVAALASFGFLAIQIYRLRGQDDQESQESYARNQALLQRLSARSSA